MTGHLALDVFAAAGIIAAGLALLGVLGRGIRKIWRTIQGVDDFLDDWQGTPERRGVPARPGVMERLSRIEHEVRTNDGSSLKDAVKRIEKQLKPQEEDATP